MLLTRFAVLNETLRKTWRSMGPPDKFKGAVNKKEGSKAIDNKPLEDKWSPSRHIEKLIGYVSLVEKNGKEELIRACTMER